MKLGGTEKMPEGVPPGGMDQGQRVVAAGPAAPNRYSGIITPGRGSGWLATTRASTGRGRRSAFRAKRVAASEQNSRLPTTRSRLTTVLLKTVEAPWGGRRTGAG